MKKFLGICLVLLGLLLIGCLFIDEQPVTTGGQPTQVEQPTLYYKDIDTVVTESLTWSTYCGTWWYYQSITVKSEEYGLEETFMFNSSGTFASMPYWSVQKGDKLKAELYSWKMDSTGEITKREINRITGVN